MIKTAGIYNSIRIGVVLLAVLFTGCSQFVSIDVRGEGDVEVSSGVKCVDKKLDQDSVNLFEIFAGAFLGAFQTAPYCSWPVDVFSRLSFTPVPNEGFIFYGWENGCKGSGSCSALIFNPFNVTAFFYPQDVADAVDALAIEDPWMRDCIAQSMINEETTDVEALQSLACYPGHPLAGGYTLDVEALTVASNVTSLDFGPGDMAIPSDPAPGIPETESLAAAFGTVSSSSFENFDSLSQFTALQSLSIERMPIPDVSIISAIPLTGLKLITVGQEDVSFLADMPSLESLNLYAFTAAFEVVGATSVLASLPNLTDLRIRRSGLDNLVGISSLDQVVSLDLEQSSYIDLTGLEEMDSLTHFSATSAILDDFAPISLVTGLESLNMSVNRELDMSTFADFDTSALVELDLSFVEFGDAGLQPFTGKAFPNLQKLDLSGTEITDLTPLMGSNFPSLTQLAMSVIRVEDYDPIQSFSSLVIFRTSTSSEVDLVVQCSEFEDLTLALPDLEMRGECEEGYFVTPGFEELFESLY